MWMCVKKILQIRMGLLINSDIWIKRLYCLLDFDFLYVSCFLNESIKQEWISTIPILHEI